MNNEEQSKRTTGKVLKFYKKYSVKDRIAVMKVFVETLKENKTNELSKPKRIIEEFYSYSDNSFDDLYELYYRKIENIKGGKVRNIDDPELFELIREFVFRHAPEKIWKLSPLLDIKAVGKSLYYFLAEDRESLKAKWRVPKIVSGDDKNEKLKTRNYKNKHKQHSKLLNIERGATYKITFSRWDHKDNDCIASEENLRRSYPEKKAIYVAIVDINQPDYNMALLFSSDSALDFYYGVNLINADFVLLKSWQYQDPLSLHYLQSAWDMEDNDNYALRSSKPIMTGGVEELHDSIPIREGYMEDHWQYRNWLYLTEDSEKSESLQKAEMLVDKLLKSRNL